MILWILTFISVGYVSFADEPKKESASVNQIGSSQPSSLKTQHSFDDFLVQGKFHFSDQTVVTVEEDKVLDGLVGVRKDFKDRIQDLE